MKSLVTEKTYALEVKAGKNSGGTARRAWEKKKVDCILYVKRDTHGGRADEVITIPIYGIARYRFKKAKYLDHGNVPPLNRQN